MSKQQEELVDKARTPDDYEELDVYPKLTDLNLDQKKLKRFRNKDTEIQEWNSAKLRGEFQKGTPDEITVTVSIKTRKKADMKTILKGRMSLENEFKMTLR